MAFKRPKKKCAMCAGKEISYKDTEVLSRYVDGKAKILPRRVTGTCSKHQRHVAREIKRSRIIALLPFVR